LLFGKGCYFEKRMSQKVVYSFNSGNNWVRFEGAGLYARFLRARGIDNART